MRQFQGGGHGREISLANRRGTRVLLCVWLVLGAVQIGGARAESFSELDVRAVYLYNFAAFVLRRLRAVAGQRLHLLHGSDMLLRTCQSQSPDQFASGAGR